MRRPGRGFKKAGHGFRETEGPFGPVCPLSFYLNGQLACTRDLPSPASLMNVFQFFHEELRHCGYCPRGENTEMQELNMGEGIGAASWGQPLPVVTDSQSHSCPAALEARQEH